MDKILNYIKNGKGIGATIILLISVLYSIFLSLMLRSLSIEAIPYIQYAADEILPIEIKDGTVITPNNVLKKYPFYSDDKLGDYSFVIDTTTDTLNTSKLESGLYLTKSYFYAVDNISGEVKSQKLKGNLALEKKDYTQILKSAVKWGVIISACIFIAYFFISYFLLNLFYTFILSYITKKLNINMNFDEKMRLSAICLSLVVIISFIFSLMGIHLHWLAFFILVIGLQILTIKKIY